MSEPARTLKWVLTTLGRHHGPPPKPVSQDPFRLILYEQVGYLVPEARRRKAFARLRAEVGLAPESILAAPEERLQAITREGGAIGAALRAARIRQSAELVLARWQGDLRGALALPLAQARRALSAFAMIGAPGAERILAATGAHAVLGLDSNGLRVLLRLGWGAEGRSYAATYASVQRALAAELPARPHELAAASALVRLHGETICRRSAPACEICPLAAHCSTWKGSQRRG